MSTLERPLNSTQSVEQFLKDCLGLDKNITKRRFKKISSDILTEQCKLVLGGKPTLTHEDNRDSKYRDETAREKLRDTILNELFTLKRLDNDDNIILGKGGALPKTAIVSNKQAYFVVGLPASGKSSIVNKIADSYGAIVIDPDYAKRKIPEYKGSPGGANLVHLESGNITLSGKNSLFGKCLRQGYNIVIPKVGNDIEQLRGLRNALLPHGYKIHLTLVELDRINATIRAFNRFKSTKRYVPLSLIFDTYANDPIMLYYKHKSEWDTSGSISTLEPIPERLESSSPTNPAELFPPIKSLPP